MTDQSRPEVVMRKRHTECACYTVRNARGKYLNRSLAMSDT